MTDHPIQTALEREHHEIDGAIESKLPADVAAECRDLLAQLDQHNSKEEPIIYPQADTQLIEDARAELEDFIATEPMPEG